MSYSDRINEVKSEIDALVTYSNETTGESDTTIGEAIGHLVEGYGGGCSTEHYFETTFEVPETTDSIQEILVSVPYDKTLRATHGTCYYVELEYTGELPTGTQEKQEVFKSISFWTPHSNTIYMSGNQSVYGFYINKSGGYSYDSYVSKNAIYCDGMTLGTNTVTVKIPATNANYHTIVGTWKLKLWESPSIHTW